MNDMEPKDQVDEQSGADKELRKRNRVLALSLVAFVVLIFFVSLVRLSGN